jgi:putative addiction module component (TIGR02574 family)
MVAANEVLTMALSLPNDQRAEIAQRLINSLPPEYELPIVIDDELEKEIERRIDDHRLGRSKSVDLETFAKTIREAAQRPST